MCGSNMAALTILGISWNGSVFKMGQKFFKDTASCRKPNLNVKNAKASTQMKIKIFYGFNFGKWCFKLGCNYLFQY